MKMIKTIHLIFTLICIVHLGGSSRTLTSCPFNPMCTCNNAMITCISVPMLSIKDTFDRPLFLAESDNFNQLVISKSSLFVIEWLPSSLSSVSLPKNNIYLVHEGVLDGSAETLSSLDLSDNNIQENGLPSERSFSRLRALQWVSLQNNKLRSLPSVLRNTNVSTLLLSGNSISTLDPDSLPVTVRTLELQSNQIVTIEGHAFPTTVISLNLANNVLRDIPLNALHRFNHLEHVSLSNNPFKSLPTRWRLSASTQVLDLSHGAVEALTEPCLGVTDLHPGRPISTPAPPLGPTEAALVGKPCLNLRSLHLEFNFIRTIEPQVFRQISVKKLFLNSNKLQTLPEQMFQGHIADSLLVLNLNENLFVEVPPCIRSLRNLTVLSLRGNQLSTLEFSTEIVPEFNKRLQVLDVSDNQLQEIPSSLGWFSALSKLSLQSNLIEKIQPGDFGDWASNLRTLNLANNAIKILTKSSFSKLKSLRELKLSFNEIQYYEVDALSAIASLQILELSSSLSGKSAVRSIHKLLSPLKSLRSLQLDYNNIYQANTWSHLSSIANLDLEGNSLNAVPDLKHTAGTDSRLNRLSLSYNNIHYLRSNSLQNVSSLEQVILIGNPLSELETHAFSHLPSVVSIILSSNKLASIQNSAFHHLPRLQRLHIDNNQIRQLSLDVFSRSGSNLFLNASSNVISQIFPSSHSNGIDIRIMDVSNNRLKEFHSCALASTPHLVRLHAARNFISRIPQCGSVSGDGGGVQLSRLIYVDLSENQITAEALYNLSRIAPSIEVLNLRANGLESLMSAQHRSIETLRSSLKLSWPLRVLDLSLNRIRPSDLTLLPSTLLSLNISQNALSIFHEHSHVLKNILSLDLSANPISHFLMTNDGPMTHLRFLNISSTNIASVSLKHGSSLLVLDASNARLKNLELEGGIQELFLRNTSISSRHSIKLPHLRNLDISHGSIRDLGTYLRTYESLTNLRELNVATNFVEKLPNSIWRMMPHLQVLNVNSNPLESLLLHTFKGLEQLRTLDMRNLSLSHLDTRVLHGLRSLSTLYVSTYNKGIRSLRLQEVLSESAALNKVIVEVEESVLSYQLQWAFTSSKIRELFITGTQLRSILPDAFLGLEKVHELILRISHTGITTLPQGLLRYLSDIRYLTLDLRYNQLQTISEDVIQPRQTVTNRRYLLGGLRLEGNPWRCSCGISWLSQWMRRWLRETVKVQRFDPNTALQIHNIARQSMCSLPNKRRVPIIEYSSDTVNSEDCTVSQASIGASSSASSSLPSPLTNFYMFIIIITATTHLVMSTQINRSL